MPILLPGAPWQATGRYDLYGDDLFRLSDRHGRELVLGPTQEEVVTLLVAGDVPLTGTFPSTSTRSNGSTGTNSVRVSDSCAAASS